MAQRAQEHERFLKNVTFSRASRHAWSDLSTELGKGNQITSQIPYNIYEPVLWEAAGNRENVQARLEC